MDIVLTLIVFLVLIGLGVLMQRTYPDWDPGKYPAHCWNEDEHRAAR